MKWSRYNFMFKSEKFGYLLYNSKTNVFAEISEDEFFKFLELSKNQNNN